MNTTRLLTQRDVARLVTMRQAIEVTRRAFESMARGETVMPSKIYLPLPGGSDFRAMPAFLRRPAAAGVKWVNVHPKNRKKKLPTIMAVIILNDPATGFPLAILDGLLITKLRTAAAAAVAAQALARPDSQVVGLIGCGAQADAQLLALAEVFNLSRVKAWGYAKGEAGQFCRQMRRRLPNVTFEPQPTLESCARHVDILVTITPSRRPLIKRSWISPGTHINAIGADAPGKQELDPQILRDAIVIIDERDQAIHGGELNVPVQKGQFDPRRIHATLGEVLLKRKPARCSPKEITVFDSTGLAIHDIALSHAVLHRAQQKGIGRQINLFALQ